MTLFCFFQGASEYRPTGFTLAANHLPSQHRAEFCSLSHVWHFLELLLYCQGNRILLRSRPIFSVHPVLSTKHFHVLYHNLLRPNPSQEASTSLCWMLVPKTLPQIRKGGRLTHSQSIRSFVLQSQLGVPHRE